MDDYAYNAVRTCECPGLGGVVTVVVIGDAVTSVYRTDTGAVLDKRGWLTIDGLFDLAANELSEEGARLRIEFDDDLGYPRLIDFSCAAIDCGYHLQVSDVRGVITSFDPPLPQG